MIPLAKSGVVTFFDVVIVGAGISGIGAAYHLGTRGPDKLKHMQAKGAAKVTVALRPEDQDMPISSWIDPEDFNPGYLMRSLDLLPKRGDKPEWQHTQDYWAEKDAIPAINLDGPEFVYEAAPSAVRTSRKARA